MPMRRPLSIVMVLLLVLRGLLGDAMAMGAAPVPSVHPAHATEAHHHAPELAQAFLATADSSENAHGAHSASAPHHAAGPAQASSTSCVEGNASACGGHEHGPSCTLCGICHSALFTPGGIEPHGAFSHASLRPQGSERFASAALLQAIKPPIS